VRHDAPPVLVVRVLCWGVGAGAEETRGCFFLFGGEVGGVDCGAHLDWLGGAAVCEYLDVILLELGKGMRPVLTVRADLSVPELGYVSGLINGDD
jgi:hypothetical protein